MSIQRYAETHCFREFSLFFTNMSWVIRKSKYMFILLFILTVGSNYKNTFFYFCFFHFSGIYWLYECLYAKVEATKRRLQKSGICQQTDN